MSKIRLYGDTSGYVDLTAPAVADNSALDISNPVFSGNLSANGTITSGVDNNSYMRVGRYSSGYGGSALNTYGGSSFLSMQVEGVEAIRANSSGYVTMPYQPAFAAQAVEADTTYSQTTVAFPTALVNVGGHYNTTNYRFTAPVSGSYYFAFNTWKSFAGVSRAYLMKNGSYITGYGGSTGIHARGSENDNTDSPSLSAIVYLNANDYVTVYDGTGSSGTRVFYSNIFCGYLIG